MAECGRWRLEKTTKNKVEKEDKKTKDKSKKSKKGKDKDEDSKDDKRTSSQAVKNDKDYQLQRALDVVRALSLWKEDPSAETE